MKMKFLLSAVLFLFCAKANAQLTLSDSLNCSNTALYATVTGDAPVGIVLADDVYSNVLPIGFNFKFYSNTYSSCVIGSNGNLSFDLGLAAGFDAYAVSAPLSGNTGVLNSICGLWADLYNPAGGITYYSTSGTAPNRKFEVTFCQVPLYSCTGQLLTSHIILYETSNIAEVHIGQYNSCAAWDTGHAIIGVQNASGTSSIAAPGRDYPSVWNSYHEGWRFSPTDTGHYAVTSITYAPELLAGSPVSWYDSSTNAFISTATTITVSPAVTTTYKAVYTECSDSAVAFITVAPSPGTPITGTFSVCVSSTTPLSNTTAGGTWTSGNPAVATVSSGGALFGVAAGTATISYAMPICTATQIVTVVAAPATAGTITGSNTVCVGLTTALADTTTGGVWSSSNTTRSTITSGGIVTGVASGVDTIKYTVTNSCGSKVVIFPMAVLPQPAVIGGTPSVCVGSTTTLTDATGGSTWSSSNTAIAAISTGGVVTGVSAGTATITYTTTLSGCYRTITVTVSPVPSPISGTTVLCVGATSTLTDTAAGGTWTSSTPAVATIGSATGLLTGIAVGTARITYSMSAGCTVTTIVTINGNPGAITPAAGVTLCLGTGASFTDGTGGGTWSSSTTSVATVSTGGNVTGVGVGTTTISYILGTGCYTTRLVTVNNAPVAITPHNPSLCMGSTVTLSDLTTGGVWTSLNTGVATIGTGGLVSTVAPGFSEIRYGIGTCYVYDTVFVIAAPAAITPVPVTICLGGTATLSDATGGGAWSSSTTSVATISTGGLVTGAGVGTTTISYTVSGCSATTVATVNTAPVAILPSSPTVCVGSTVTLTDATGGGIWTSTATGVATVAGGVVTGVTAGTTTISYAIGTCAATTIVTVHAVPAAITPAPVSICLGGTVTLSDATGSGAWSSANTSVATISTGGLVTGAGIGTTTISYTVSGCAATTVATVNTAPVSILPASPTVCMGSTVTLTDATGGGVWASGTPGIATVTGGVVTGVTVGTATISYSVGTCTTTTVVTVNALPAAISPVPVVICLGSNTTLTDATGSGAWSSSNAGVATITAGGVVTGTGVGTSTISYTASGCSATTIATVNTAPVAISPAGTTVCTGSTATLTDATGGGIWSSSNTGVATVAGGVVTGVTAGTATISYSVGSCNTTTTVTVNLTPSPITPTPASVCQGGTTTLSDVSGGGAWSSSASGIASVSAGGVVTGVAGGTATISYTVGGCSATTIITVNISGASGTILGPSTICQGSFDIYINYTAGGTWSLTNGLGIISSVGVVDAISTGADTVVYTVVNACGSATATLPITIIPSSGAGSIAGPSGVCQGSTITLTNAASPGGTWSASNGHASIGLSSGIVTGLSAGVDTISYIVTTPCGTFTNTATVVVDASSTPATISGPSSVCVSASITLTDADAGGVWSSSNSNATAVPSTGLITGVFPGLDTITYSVVNACGFGSITKIITVVPTPPTGTISGPSSVCLGSSITLTESIPGGTWSAANGNATVSATGLVTGLAVGTDDIIYTLTAACGTVSTSATITINPLPDAGTITGPDSVCVGSTIALADAMPGGAWSTGNTNASVDPSGVVTGVVVGTVPVSYAVTNTCGTNYATKVITVGDIADPGVITGIGNVCIGSSITLIDTVPGGLWLSSNATATIVGPGIISGASVGVDSIFYVVINACGTNEARHIVTVNPTPVVPAITGLTSQCAGTNISLSDGLAGGNWSTSDATIAMVDGLGLVTGLSGGIVTVSYTVVNAFGCPGSALSPDTVIAIPVSSPITGNTNLCLGSANILSDAITGGGWSSVDGTIASIDPVTGAATGVALGTTTIIYTVNNVCGSATDSASVTVNDLPAISPITGTTATVCAGTNIVLNDATVGGVWSSTNTGLATIDGTGMVTGVATGIDTTVYTVTNGSGCSASAIYTINVAPGMGSVTVTPAAATLCHGSLVTMSATTAVGGLTYQWLINGNPVAGATDSTYTADSNGTYSLIVSNGICAETIAGTVVSQQPHPVITFTAPNILTTGSFASYQWYKNGIAIAGATSATYHETGVANYTVVVSDGNGCADTSAAYHISGGGGGGGGGGVGVSSSPVVSAIRVYPNPASSTLTIDAPEKVNVSLLSIDGKVLVEQKEATSIDVSALANGMYLIMIYDEHNLLLMTSKFVKSN